MNNFIKLIQNIIIFFFLSITSLGLAQQPGSLDFSFGNGGKVTIDISVDMKTEGAHSLGIQPDGKIVVGGGSGQSASFGHEFFSLARLDSNGVLDNTFGTGGTVMTDVGMKKGAKKLFILPDHKILLASYEDIVCTPTCDNYDIVFARYTNDGALDFSFGQAGIITNQINLLNPGTPGFIISVSSFVQADGKIILTGLKGKATATDSADVWFARFNKDGYVDNSFGNSGVASINLDTTALVANSFATAIQTDGKIVVAGSIFIKAPQSPNFIYDTEDTDLFIARFTTDGLLDNSFGNGGVATLDITTDTYDADGASVIELQPDGKILVAGFSATHVTDSSNSVIKDVESTFIARFNPDGTLDNNFGNNGITVTEGYGFGENSMVLQPNGQIIVAGRAQSNQQSLNFAIMRYNEDGSVDNIFGGDGLVTTDFFGGHESIRSVAIQKDG